MNASDSPEIPDALERWLTAATAELIPDAADNCRIELFAHFSEAVESFDPAIPLDERQTKAIDSLGDAIAVNQQTLPPAD